MKYIIHYDVAAIFVTVIILYSFSYRKTIATKLSYVFLALTTVGLLSDALDLITIYLIEHPTVVPLPVNELLNMLYLFIFNASPAVCFCYILTAIRGKEPYSRKEFLLLTGPIALDGLLIFTTHWTHLVFYFDQNIYTHGPGFYVLYVSAFYYMIIAAVYTVLHKNKLTTQQRATVYFYTVGTLITIVLQMMYGGLMIIQFAISLAILMVYVSLEHPENYEDQAMHVKNRLALQEIVDQHLMRKRSFVMIGVQIGGSKYLIDTLGLSHALGYMKAVAEFLNTIKGEGMLFCLEPWQFVILIDAETVNFQLYVQTILERFHQPFSYNKVQVMLDVDMCTMTNEAHQLVEDADEVVRMMENALVESEETPRDHIVEADEDVMERGRREGQILDLLRTAVHDHNFQVYYQPIYSVRKKRFTTAEALVRLMDDRMGYISPEEFIPIAERHGLILEIGAFVFEEACRFLASSRLLEKGIDYLEINLSTVQCMQEKLAEQLLRVMDRYHLPYWSINLEITETAAVMSEETLHRNMEKLMDHGVHFSLDDYGTGFSNTASIIAYPFHVIKLDKSMLWSAKENEKAMRALEYSIAMIQSMNMWIVCEGVETKEQAQMLEEMGCDFFQGFYYSKPIPGKEFVEIMEQYVLEHPEITDYVDEERMQSGGILW